MLRAVQIPNSVSAYIQSLYSQLWAVVKCKAWCTPTIPICRGIFQGDTMSLIIFILAFNPLLRLAEVLNHGYGFCFKLMVPGSHYYPLLILTFILNGLRQVMNCLDGIVLE